MDLNQLKKSALEDIKKIQDVKGLEQIRIKYLGRQDGELIKILRSLKDLPLEEKRKLGPADNSLRNEIENLLATKLEALKAKTPNLISSLDITLPGKKVPV